jgi:hypothetical protein
MTTNGEHTNGNDPQGVSGRGEHSVEKILRSILDLTLAMERSTDAEDYQKITELMSRRDLLVEEASKLRIALNSEQAGVDLVKAIDRENTILMAQLQQKRDLIAARLQGMDHERAIAHYRK